jgi:hypothetical protein
MPVFFREKLMNSAHRQLYVAAAVIVILCVAGCETTNSIPYKASTSNVITIQQSLKASDKKVSLGSVSMAPGVEDSPLCRLMGPVKVAPGKTPAQYIKDAFQEELFAAGVYAPNASTVIDGTITNLTFSSVSPASWNISMAVKSNSSPGYTVNTKYDFGTSFTAWDACKNVADAFGPAVQELLKQVVSNPQFAALAN